MKHQAYYPTNVPEQIIWLTNFFNKLIGHAPTLGISAAECAAAVADCRWLIYVLGSWQPAQRAWAKSCTDAVRDAQLSGTNILMVLPVFVPPPLPGAVGGLPAVVPTNTGALNRIFSLVQTMKEKDALTEAMSTDLGIVGTETPVPDMGVVQPEFTVKIIGGHVFIEWGWGGKSAFLNMIQIQVDRGDGQGFINLAFDTTPGYTDTAPFPAALTKWKYRAIYHAGDAQVGLWSAEVSITVGG